MNLMNYDIDAALPDCADVIYAAYKHLLDNPPKANESLFLPDFPLGSLAALNATIITMSLVGVYTQADSVFGGAGVRIYVSSVFKSSKLDTHQPSVETPPKRTVGDWTAIRKPDDVWIERVSEWFGFDIYDDAAFLWDKVNKNVEVLDLTADNIPPYEPFGDKYRIDPITAMSFMTDAGQHYRNGMKEPKPSTLDKQHIPYMNVWVGFKQAVWLYSVNENAVLQFGSHADADYYMNSKGVDFKFEDAPLIAWLGYNAAQAYKAQQTPAETVNNTPSDAELDDL